MSLRIRLMTAGIVALGASALLFATGEREPQDSGSRQAAYRGVNGAELGGVSVATPALGMHAQLLGTPVHASWEALFRAWPR